MEKLLMARIALLEGAVIALLRVHPDPDKARDELRVTAERLLVPLDDAPDCALAEATVLQFNAFEQALVC